MTWCETLLVRKAWVLARSQWTGFRPGSHLTSGFCGEHPRKLGML